ncbi:MAG TPA: cation diffusion facilitator family transporter [Mycobacteriales bacterium]|nr:cation diffusion facilitator family transporter [Mycobacteriales bacterium]
MSGEHGHAHARGSAGGRHRRPLAVAFGLTFAYMIVELVAGIVTGSLALLSDAAHMGTDVLGLGMALAAITLASRPAPSHRTWGAYRLEVLAALANGLLLFGVAGYVLFEAYRRFTGPPEIPGTPLLVVATLGLVVNLVSVRLLMAGSKESLNVRGAYLEVFADLLGSIGVIVAAVVLLTTGWAYVDPIVGAGIGLFILPRTWQLMGRAVRILMEAAPRGVDVDDVRDRIRGLDGVADVHDLHIWTVTSGLDTASGHVVVDPGADYHGVLDRVTSLLAEDYGVTHATIQCEPDDHTEHSNPV